MSQALQRPSMILVGLLVLGLTALSQQQRRTSAAGPTSAVEYISSKENVPLVRGASSTLQQQQHLHQHRETRPFIDGAERPDLIPDAVAYSHFLRMLVEKDRSAKATKRQRALIKHVLAYGNPSFQHASSSRVAVSPDVDAVVRFIEKYQPRLEELDRSRGTTSEEAILVQQIVDEMPAHLEHSIAARLQAYATTVFKRTIKIIQ